MDPMGKRGYNPFTKYQQDIPGQEEVHWFRAENNNPGEVYP